MAEKKTPLEVLGYSKADIKSIEAQKAVLESGLSKPRSRPIHEIAAEIRKEWPKPYFGAVPYLNAMSSLGGINDSYGMDDAASILNYFLANAQTFKGERARAIKRELKAIMMGKV